MFKHPLLYVWIVLIGAFIGVGLLRPPEHDGRVAAVGPTSDDIKRAEQGQGGQPKQDGANIWSSILKRQPPPSEDKSACRESEKDEICFQRRSAVAAEDQARATEDQALYTLLGLILLVLTLGFTAWAAVSARQAARATGISAEYARQAVEAANQTNAIAAHTTRVELRAYISVIPAGINELIGSQRAMGHVDVRNMGRLPARNVTVEVRMGLSHREITPDPRAWDFPIAEDFKKEIDRAIPPGAEMRQGAAELDTMPVKDLLGERDKYVYVWGVVYYDDGYVRRFTKFRHRYAIASHARGQNWDVAAKETRVIIGADKARLHPFGNNLN